MIDKVPLPRIDCRLGNCKADMTWTMGTMGRNVAAGTCRARLEQQQHARAATEEGEQASLPTAALKLEDIAIKDLRGIKIVHIEDSLKDAVNGLESGHGASGHAGFDGDGLLCEIALIINYAVGVFDQDINRLVRLGLVRCLEG
jgi:hypothetical protein